MQAAWPPRPQSLLSHYQNITRTCVQGPETESFPDVPSDNGAACCYIARTWRYGDGDPFCGAPVVRGSAYCVSHQQLCRIAAHSDTAAGASRALATVGETAPPPPPELCYLEALPIPEREIEGELVPELSRALDLDAAIADATLSDGEP
jgi:hypothetical protein